MNAISTFCPICKQRNLAGVEECAFCGAQLPKPGTTTAHISPDGQQMPLSPQAKAPAITVPEGSFAIAVMGNEAMTMTLQMNAELILGRVMSTQAEGNLIDLTPYHAGPFGVSRHHAKIIKTDSGYTLEDLQSTNGTWLNRVALTPKKTYPLQNGDEIRLGKLWLIFYCS
jgi:pSer/pThr/pTyr-binding forkhead associated (FHA) protein